MAISVPVTPVGGGAANGGNFNLSISGVQADDVIYFAASWYNSSPAAPSNTGWTNPWTVLEYRQYSTRLFRLYRNKWVSGDPTTVSWVGSGILTSGEVGVVIVCRGVDLTTPEDVSTVFNTGGPGATPNCDPITPESNDCLIIAIGANNINDATIGNSPSDYLPNPAAQGTASDTNSTSIALSYRILTGGAGNSQDPGAWSSWANGTWGVLTIAVRSATKNLLPSLVTNINNFYSPVLVKGTVNLSPSLFSNTNTFYTHVLEDIGLNVRPNLFVNTYNFYTPEILTNTVELLPGLFINTSIFYTNAISFSISPSLFGNTNNFYTQIITVGEVSLVSDLFINTNTFYTPLIYSIFDLQPNLLVNTNNISYVSKITLNINIPYFIDPDNFYIQTITTGLVNLTPNLFNNINNISNHIISPGLVDLSPSLFTNNNVFNTTIIEVIGSVGISASTVIAQAIAESTADSYGTSLITLLAEAISQFSADETLLVLRGPWIPPYAARGLTQIIEPLWTADVRRSINGVLVDITPSIYKKYKTRISCADFNLLPITDITPGFEVTVDCVSELSYKSGNLPEREVVEGSQRTVNGYIFYRPRLKMLVTGFNITVDEYGAVASWQLEMEEKRL